jgi:2-hydroxy-5-methyl-1-naphthoate 7-hydroxylase
VAEPPLRHLDPMGTDHHGEAASTRELGPVVRVVSPGEVPVFAVPTHELVAELVANPLVSSGRARPATGGR